MRPLHSGCLGRAGLGMGALNLVLGGVTPIFLGVLRRRPHRLAWIINGIFALVFALQLVETAVLGGLLESGLVVLSGLCLVLGALVAMGLKTTIRRPAAQHPP